MAARDLKVLIKTLSDVTGLTRLGSYLRSHSASVRALIGTYKALESAGKAAISVIGSELRGLRNLAAGSAVALAGAVREGYRLNTSLSQTVNMASGNKLANFVRFRQEILRISSETGLAAAEINKALYQALSAQMAPDDAFAAIRKSAQGVVADGAQLPEVMSGIIAATKSFGGSVSESAESLYRIVQLGQTTFGEVGQYLSQVAPVAAANEVSLQEVGGAIAQLTSKTIPLSQTVNMLRNMMSKLNIELGDGWHKTMTFQDAMERVAQTAGYSQVKLAAAFGLENLAGVNALIGKNFADSKRQLQEFKGQLGGLSEAAAFSDSLRGWAKILQTALNFVREIGSEIEMRWAPRIQVIAAKLESLRQGAGWKELVDRVAARLEAAVTYTLVQIRTAADLIAELRASDFGMARLMTLGKTVIRELIELAVTLFLGLLEANVDVFLGLARVFGAAFKAEIMKIDIPGRREAQNARLAAIEKLRELTPDQAEERGVRRSLAGSIDLPDGDINMVKFNAQRDWAKQLTLDQAVDFVTADSMDDMRNAFQKTRQNLGEVAGKIETQWASSSGNIKAAALQTSGGQFNWDERAAQNRATLQSVWTPPAATAAVDPRQVERERALNALRSGRESQVAAVSRMEGQYGDSQSMGVLNVLAQERDRVKKIDKAIEQVMAGNQQTLDRILAYLQSLEKQNQRLSDQLRRLPL